MYGYYVSRVAGATNAVTGLGSINVANAIKFMLTLQ